MCTYISVSSIKISVPVGRRCGGGGGERVSKIRKKTAETETVAV